MVNHGPAALRLLLLVCLCAFAMPGFAQTSDEPAGPEPAHLAYLDGSATVTRDGRAEPATINLPLIAGDQLRTREGRVDVLFGDGSVLDADHFTAVDFLSDELLRLLEGRVRLTVGGRDRVAYRIDTPSGAVRIDAPGEYRVSLIGESGRADVELVTIRGYATLVNDLGETPVRAGERAFATAGMAPSYAQAYNSATWDAFDRWADDRRDERTGTMSAQYLPDEIRGYSGDFDRYGDWRYEGTYGYVWYPRVRVDWRPYYYGRWNYYGPWGWTWIAYDPWGWPTHHYGRWGVRAGLWFWIPSRYWAPAYVYWAGASDYIGWCPLGWDNRPIFNIININVGRNYRGYDGYDPYRAWTVVPRRAFSSHVDVGRYAVARAEIDRAVPRWYVSGATAPVRPAALTRSAPPIYSAGRASVARGASVSGSPGAPVRSAPRAYGSGGSISGWTAGTDRSAPRGIGSGTSVSGPRGGAARSVTPETAVPRATPPSSAGTLGPSTNWPRYRDMGPGGPDVRDRQVPDTQERARARSPERGAYVPRGVPDGGVYAPRGVPGNSRVYAPRGVPRDSGVSSSPREIDQPSPSYRAPVRQRPDREIYAPGPSRDRPSYGPGPSSGPGPSYGPPPSSPRRAPSASDPSDGEGRERAAPRGGSAPPAPRGGGDRPHARRPQ